MTDKLIGHVGQTGRARLAYRKDVAVRGRLSRTVIEEEIGHVAVQAIGLRPT